MQCFKWLILISSYFIHECTSSNNSTLITSLRYRRHNFIQSENSETFLRRKRQIDATKSKNMFLNITQRVAISTAFIPVKMHSFVKEIPFQVIAENIQQLKFQLRHLNPSDATIRKSYIEGRANSYIITSYPHFVSQNTLACAEHGGTIASMAQIISDRLELTESVTASDEMSIVNGEILCTYISTPNRNIHCISQLRNLASILGLRFLSGPDHKIFQDLVLSLIHI